MADAKILVEHAQPAGFSVWSRESDHSYWGDVKRDAAGNPKSATDRWGGVSTATKPADYSPDGLMGWAAKLTCAGAAELVADALSYADPSSALDHLGAQFADASTVNSSLYQAGLTWGQQRDAAAQRGTNVHEQFLVALAQGDSPPSLADAADDERGYAQGVLAFWRDHEPDAIQVETVVGDPALKLAGRFDLRGTIDGRMTLLDLKTRSGTFSALGHHLQVEGYELLARSSGLGETERRVILYVTPEGEYELVESVADQAAKGMGMDSGMDAFVATWRVYRLAAHMKKALRS